MLLKSLVSKLGCKFVEFKTLTTCDRVVPCTAIAVNKEREGERFFEGETETRLV